MSSSQTFVSVNFVSLNLPRIIPSNVCISWRCNNEVGKTETFPSNSLNIQINQGFVAKKVRGEPLEFSVAVHAVNKQGFSMKFSEEKVIIPDEIHTRIDMYRHANIQSSIGPFMIEMKFSLQQKPFQQNTAEPGPKIEEYKSYIDSFSPLMDELDKPDKYLKASNLIHEISEIPASSFEKEDIDKLASVLSQLKLKSKQINARFELIVDSILALMEKQFLYVTNDGKVANYGDFHNSTEQRFPLISIVICRSLIKLLDKDLSFKTDQIEQFLLDICALFANIIASRETSDRGYLYLISAVTTIYKFLETHIQVHLDSFKAILMLTYKQALVQALEVDKEQIIEMSIKDFVSWYKEHAVIAYDINVPPEALSLIHNCLCQYYDYQIAKKYLAQSVMPPPNFVDLQKAVPVKWNYLSGITFIYNNAELIIKKKADMNKIPPECKGSVMRKILSNLVANKKLKASERQINAVVQKDVVDSPSIAEFVETKARILPDPNIPYDLPKPANYGTNPI